MPFLFDFVLFAMLHSPNICVSAFPLLAVPDGAPPLFLRRQYDEVSSESEPSSDIDYLAPSFLSPSR